VYLQRLVQHLYESHIPNLSIERMADIPSEPPSRGLKGKVSIVTGAGCAGEGIGNGRAISIMLADEGSNVLCLDMNLEWAQKTVAIASSKPGRGRAIALKADVTKATDCEAAVQLALHEFGRLDVLINNVGIGGATGTAVEVDMEAWAKGLEINVSSMVQMAKYAIPAMLKNEGETRGSIINMGSVAGLKGGTPHLLYPTSKGAVVNMTRAMSAHHAADGIRVNCVCPGMLYTPMLYAGGMSDEVREARRKRSLLGTEGTAWDAACAVTFLASDHARWITGAVLPVDAGTTAAVGIGMPKSASVNG
jgi:NAD(P)-dependent dehydrogenase (short-subunit alcohol dehydrogenase family)